MLNRKQRRYLAVKLRANKQHHWSNIKAAQLPQSITPDDFIGICQVAGISPKELLDVGRR